MPRPKKNRKIFSYPDYWSFSPESDAENGEVTLTLDEFEAIRLIDYQQKTQEQCATKMDVARTTVTAIYDRARKKIADALINGKRITISGGNYTLHNDIFPKITEKGNHLMRIAVTYSNEEIFQHFGRSKQFKLYDIAGGKIIDSQIVDVNGAGHGALAGFLKNAQTDVLICGGIGGGAQTAVAEAGIELYAGNSGNADKAVTAYMTNSLAKNDTATCNHHHAARHACGAHACRNK